MAAKTGTTQNWKDGWTLGFTPQLAAGVWAGNNDSSLMRAGADGVFVAAPMWNRFMELALAGQPAVDFPVPSGIVQIAYDPGSNRPATKTNKNTRLEPFPWYALPKEAQISAAPKSLNKGLLTPIVEPIIPTPLTAPSTLPKPAPVTPLPAPVPGIVVPDNIPNTSQSYIYEPTIEYQPDYGGLPNDYPTEPQAVVPGRPADI